MEPIDNAGHSRCSEFAIESEREFGLSVLEGIDAELKRRGDLFRNAGADNLKNYRQKTHQSLPRILLLVDEFQEFFTENDKLASDAAQMLDRLVRQASVGCVPRTFLRSQWFVVRWCVGRTLSCTS
ncbi:MAG: hypothetical protein ABFS56_15975 [Pseudomonadota bacterium]